MSGDPDSITEVRLQLLQKGYSPIPVIWKKPLFDGWQTKITVTRDEIASWRTQYSDFKNTGALTRKMPTIDIDILEEAAAVAVEELARQYFEEHGFFLVRIGQPPKRAVILRTDNPFRKIVHDLIGPNGNGSGRIEILGDGQQVVVAGIHPDTKQEYRWHGGNPRDIAWADLPYIDEARAIAFANEAVNLLVLDHGYSVPSKKGNGSFTGKLEEYCDLIRNAEKGHWDEACRQVFFFGRLCGGGAYDPQAALDALLKAARDNPTAPPDYSQVINGHVSKVERSFLNGVEKPIDTPLIQIQSTTEFITDFAPPEYLIYPVIQRRFIYSMTAPTGDGKTSVALSIAHHVDQGIPIGGHDVDKGRVLILAGENPDDVRMRWIKILDEKKMDAKDVNVCFVPGSFALSDKVMRDRIVKANEAHGPFDLIIVDTSAAFFEGDDENTNPLMLAHAKMLRGLIDLIGGNPTVIVTSHPVKNWSRENMVPRGGGAFLNEMDGNLTCMKVDGTMITELHWCGKFRGPDFSSIPFRLEAGTCGRLKDSKGRDLWTVIAYPITLKERDAAEKSAENNKSVLLEAIQEMPGASYVDLAKECDFYMKNGEPYKSLVVRLITALKNEKKIKKQSGRWVLTKLGKGEIQNEIPF